MTWIFFTFFACVGLVFLGAYFDLQEDRRRRLQREAADAAAAQLAADVQYVRRTGVDDTHKTAAAVTLEHERQRRERRSYERDDDDDDDEDIVADLILGTALAEDYESEEETYVSPRCPPDLPVEDTVPYNWQAEDEPTRSYTAPSSDSYSSSSYSDDSYTRTSSSSYDSYSSSSYSSSSYDSGGGGGSDD